MDICQNGLPFLSCRTLIPGHAEISEGQLVYLYNKGKVVEQKSPMTKDVLRGDDFLVHLLSIEFADAKLVMNEWHEDPAKRRLSVVPKTENNQ